MSKKDFVYAKSFRDIQDPSDTAVYLYDYVADVSATNLAPARSAVIDSTKNRKVMLAADGKLRYLIKHGAKAVTSVSAGNLATLYAAKAITSVGQGTEIAYLDRTVTSVSAGTEVTYDKKTITEVVEGTAGTARFTHASGTAIPVGTKVKNLGFEETSYNVIGIVTVSAATYYELDVDFVDDDAGYGFPYPRNLARFNHEEAAEVLPVGTEVTNSTFTDTAYDGAGSVVAGALTYYELDGVLFADDDEGLGEVTSNYAARFTHTSGTAVPEAWEVTNTLFTDTSYNGTAAVTVSAVTYYELEGILFNATGTGTGTPALAPLARFNHAESYNPIATGIQITNSTFTDTDYNGAAAVVGTNDSWYELTGKFFADDDTGIGTPALAVTTSTGRLMLDGAVYEEMIPAGYSVEVAGASGAVSMNICKART
jgi:hypothetical protein